MEGKVKWFSKQKGFGFIVGNDGIERFFGVRDIKGVDLPNNGALVEFESAEGKKGPKAINIVITSKGESRSDERISCRSCGKKMIPRIITGPPLVHGQGSWTPVPKKSVCPFCGSLHQKFPPFCRGDDWCSYWCSYFCYCFRIYCRFYFVRVLA